MLFSIVLSGWRISQEITIVYMVTLRQAIINVLIDAATLSL